MEKTSKSSSAFFASVLLSAQHSLRAARMAEPAGLDEEVSGGVEITLRSKDNKEMKILKSWAFVSNLVKTSLENDTSATSVDILGLNPRFSSRSSST